MGNKKLIWVYLEKEYIEMIDAEVAKIGCGAKRSAWIKNAIEKELKILYGYKKFTIDGKFKFGAE